MTPLLVDLSRFRNDWYKPGRPFWVRALWFFIGQPILGSRLLPFLVRRSILRLFGAKVGRAVVIKPGVRVKYPWLLTIGDYSWIGEDCWIDNLAPVVLEHHVCVSQGVYICTGNHDWSDPGFGLMIKPVTLRHAAWIGASSVLTPGVEIGEGAVASAGSVVLRSIAPMEIHGGNPATFIRRRLIQEQPSSIVPVP